MLPRVFHAEDGKDLAQRIQPRGYLFSIVKYFGPFLLLAAGFFIFGARFFDTRILKLQSPKSGFLPCITVEPSGINRWIKPPSSLLHNMSDHELFWLASFAPEVKNYPFKRLPKVAFMFLTRGPLPLSPLWEKFFKGNEGLYSIYIHSLPGYKASYPKDSVFYKRQIPSQVAEWGRMSMCDAEKRLLANALLDLSNEWFVLLSESCIPLYNFSIIYKYFQRSHFSFMGVFDDKGPHGRGRYNPNMAPLITIDQWRKGSQWFEVDRKLAIYILQDTKYYSKFKEFCKPPCYVDEHYFPTMLHIEKSDLIANSSLTFVDWSRGGAHPATFGKDDITEEFMKKKLLSGWDCMYNGQHSSLCVLFARKFAPSSLQPLLQLAPALLGYG
ncbi:hypothetical protein KFK09_016416 [Dendrobium nobile]|uniref:Core-2/I-branching beta-1,6-N-acetylglucosaminyltransferase family protein n=1 Tax=Dendrobium nobile TaxID=94219 RepID=A0A8T3AZF6_DENNO|nr:hypothetical protein KFK09_016416 [Dendrobium nobile]